MRYAIFALALGVAGTLGACSSSDVDRQLGARCDRNSDCDERCLGPSMEWPGGFCTTSCDSDADCPEGASCVDEGGGNAVCAFACIGDVDCNFLSGVAGDYTCKERDRIGAMGKTTVCRGE